MKESLKVKMGVNLYAVILMAHLYPSSSFYPYTLSTDQVQVIDGDTIIANGKKVRLAYIDTPELKQAYGDFCRDYLKSLIQGKKLAIKVLQKGSYGRLLGVLYVDNMNINLKLVEKGVAYLYPYSQFQTKDEKWMYLRTYQIARNKKINLWSKDNLLNPRKFRQKKASLKRKANVISKLSY